MNDKKKSVNQYIEIEERLINYIIIYMYTLEGYYLSG